MLYCNCKGFIQALQNVWNGPLWAGAPTESKLCSTVKLWARRGTWMKPFHTRSEVGRDVVGPCGGSNNGPTNNSFSTRTQSSLSSFSRPYSHAAPAPSGVPSRSRARHCPGWKMIPRKGNFNRVTVILQFFLVHRAASYTALPAQLRRDSTAAAMSQE